MLCIFFSITVLFFFSIYHLLFGFIFFFFNDTATTEIYTLSLHDALPICCCAFGTLKPTRWASFIMRTTSSGLRSEEHTSELQSPCNLVCRLLLEKKKNKPYHANHAAPH